MEASRKQRVLPRRGELLGARASEPNQHFVT
jgi:hypothetical protein